MTRVDALLLILVSIPAVLLRLLFLDRIPPALMSDEISYLGDAIELLKGHLSSPFASGSWDAVYLHDYTIAATTLLVPDRLVAERLVGVIPGILSVPLLYLVMRILINRTAAFCAAMLMALSWWHLILSRYGYHWSINGFVALGALYGLARGLRTGRLQDYVLAGCCLGLGVLYTYGAALMPVVIVAFVIYLAVLHRPLLTRRTWLGLGFLVLAAAIVAAPRLSTIEAHPEMMGWHRYVSVFSPQWVGQAPTLIPRQYGEMLLSFNIFSDEDTRSHPQANEPLLDVVSAVAFGLGFFYALWRIRSWPWMLLVLCFLVSLLPSALSTGQTNWATAWRSCAAVCAIFGLAAAPLAVVWQRGAGLRVGRLALSSLFALFFIAVGVINIHDYFVVFPANGFYTPSTMLSETEAGKRLLATPPDTRLLVEDDLSSTPYVPDYAFGRRTYESGDWPNDSTLPPLLTANLRPTLVIAPAQRDYQTVTAGDTLVTLLAHYFPGGQQEDRTTSLGQLMYADYVLQPTQIRAAYGLSASYAPARGGPSVQETTATIFDWRHSPAGAFPLRVALHGTLFAPVSGRYHLAVQGCQQPRVIVDGRPFTRGMLLAGLHEIRISAEVRGATQARLVWSINGAPLTTVPVGAVLRQDLPAWGFTELAATPHTMVQRWVPAVWYNGAVTDAGIPLPAQDEWDGQVRLPATGAYTLQMPAVGSLQMWMDGQQIPVPAGQPQLRFASLAGGWHRLRVVITAPRPGRGLFFWHNDNGEYEILGGAASRPTP